MRAAPPSDGLVLLIENDPDVRVALDEALSAASMEVLTANDRGHALRILDSGVRPSAIILDLIMQGLDTQTFQHELARLKLASIPLIVMSSASRHEIPTPPHTVKRLQKPISFRDLIAALKLLKSTPKPLPRRASEL